MYDIFGKGWVYAVMTFKAALYYLYLEGAFKFVMEAPSLWRITAAVVVSVILWMWIYEDNPI